MTKKTTSKKTTRKPGRPAGSKTADRDHQVVVESRCQKCGSTNREKYTGTVVLQGDGVAPDQKPYSERLIAKTRCLDCGQARVVSRYKYVPESGNPPTFADEVAAFTNEESAAKKTSDN